MRGELFTTNLLVDLVGIGALGMQPWHGSFDRKRTRQETTPLSEDSRISPCVVYQKQYHLLEGDEIKATKNGWLSICGLVEVWL